MENDESAIINLLKQGNEKAYKYLYDHHYVLLCKMAYEFVKDNFIAETIVGDTIFHLWETRNTLDIQISIRSYLVRAVRNRCINHLKLEYEQRVVHFSSFANDENEWTNSLFDADSYPLASLLAKELENEICQSIDRLPDECRQVFLKSRFEEKSYQEIAVELNISVNTVKYHMKNALFRLNADLSKYLMIFLFAFQ